MKEVEDKENKALSVSKLSYFDHVIIERNGILNFKANNSPMKMIYMLKNVAATVWAKMMLNSYHRALDIRGEGIIKYAKIKMERQKEKDAKVSFSNIRWLMRILGYIWLACIIFAMFLPGLMINYIKNQVKSGDWVDTQPLISTVQNETVFDENLMIVTELNSTQLMLDELYAHVSENQVK